MEIRRNNMNSRLKRKEPIPTQFFPGAANLRRVHRLGALNVCRFLRRLAGDDGVDPIEIAEQDVELSWMMLTRKISTAN